jgi:hypothetical protein
MSVERAEASRGCLERADFEREALPQLDLLYSYALRFAAAEGYSLYEYAVRSGSISSGNGEFQAG